MTNLKDRAWCCHQDCRARNGGALAGLSRKGQLRSLGMSAFGGKADIGRIRSLRSSRRVRKICAMRRALQKLLALVLTAGLMAGGPVCAHAQMNPCGSATSYETHAVSHYADLSIDPEDGSSADAQLPSHHHDDGLCKKCCATCVSANLPTSMVSLATLTISARMVLALDDDLVARTVPTEPGIPKPL